MNLIKTVTSEHQQDKNVLNFNRSHASLMQSIGQNFFDNTGINKFTFCRSFSDGKRFYWSTNLLWVELYIVNSFHKDSEHFDHYTPAPDVSCALWQGFKQDKVFAALYEANMWHGFTLYERSTFYVDLFDFAGDRESYQLIDFYINHIELLKNFVKYFKKKLLNHIKITDENKLLIPQNAFKLSAQSSSLLVESHKVITFLKQTHI